MVTAAGRRPAVHGNGRGQQEDSQEQREGSFYVPGPMQILVPQNQLGVGVHGEECGRESQNRCSAVTLPGQPADAETGRGEDDQGGEVTAADLVQPGGRRPEPDHVEDQGSEDDVKDDEGGKRE